jgi:hypothetical protein
MEQMCKRKRIPANYFVGKKILQLETYLENIVNFRKKLHITIFDSVVNHLDVVSRSNRSDVSSAGFISDLCGTLGHDGSNEVPGRSGTTGHERRSVTGTLFSSRNSHTDKLQALLGEFLSTTDSVGVPFVTTINNDIILLQKGNKLSNGIIDGLSGLHQKDNFAGLGELFAKVGGSVGSNQGKITLGLGASDSGGNLGGRTVADTNLKAVFGHVEGKVLSHDGKSPKSNVGAHDCSSSWWC